MNLTASLPSPQNLVSKRARWIKWLIFVVCALALVYFSRARQVAVLPAQPQPADSLAILLAIAGVAALAVFATRVADTEDAAAYTLLLAAVAVAGFFALTRELGIALALFCAGIAVLVSYRRTKSERAGSVEASQAKTSNVPELVPVLLASIVIFAVGVVVAVLFGREVLHIPKFGIEDVLGYSDRQPLPFITGKNWVLGPGLYTGSFQQWRSAPGSAPDVLALIGHETGLLGLIGVILVFVLLFVSLAFLARSAAKTGDRTGAALAWGLIVFLMVQVLLAAETLIPHGVPVGDGSPLLSGGWADYLADLIAIGIVIGLSWRPVSASVPAARAVQMKPAAVSTRGPRLETYANNE